jgi:hypothetical protein
MCAFLLGRQRFSKWGSCLVACDKICTPTSFGGLGVKDLRLQGLDSRVRWEWLRHTDASRLWQGLSMMDTDAYDTFQSLVRIQVGDGRKVLFWRDRWINGRAAEDLRQKSLRLSVLEEY